MSTDQVLLVHHSIITSEWISALLKKNCGSSLIVDLRENWQDAKKLSKSFYGVVILELYFSSQHDKLVEKLQCDKLFLIGEYDNERDHAERIMDKFGDDMDISYYNEGDFILSLRDIIRREKLLCYNIK